MSNSLSSLTRGLLTAAAFGIATLASLGAHAQVAYSVDTASDNLYSINLTTGVATLIGPVGLGGDVEGLSFQPGTNILFGLDDDNNQLITINTATGAGTVVGPLGASSFSDSGLEFAANGVLYGSTDLSDDGLYQIDPLTGTATFIGGDADAHALGFFGGVLYGIRDTDDSLATIDPTDGSVTVIGEIGFTTDEEGFVIDAAGTAFLVAPDNDSSIYTVNLLTGAATFLTTVSCAPACRFESLAIADLFQAGPGSVAAPIPAVPVFGIALLAALMVLAGVRSRNRQRN